MVCTMLAQTPLATPAGLARSTARPSRSPAPFRSVRRVVAVRAAEKSPLDQLEEKAQVGVRASG